MQHNLEHLISLLQGYRMNHKQPLLMTMLFMDSIEFGLRWLLTMVIIMVVVTTIMVIDVFCG